MGLRKVSPPFGFGGTQLGSDIFVPSQIPGCQLWLRADLGVVNSGGVIQWNDQSGTRDGNKNATASGTAKPTFNSRNPSYSGMATIDFNGTTNYMQSGIWATALTQPFTDFIVCNTTVAANLLVLDGIATQTSINNNSGLLETYAGSTNLVDLVDVWNSSVGVVCAVFSGASSAIYFNSLSAKATGNPGTTARNGTTIGGYSGAPGNTSNSWNGSIAEIITYNGILAQSEINTIIGYLGRRYNIPIGS